MASRASSVRSVIFVELPIACGHPLPLGGEGRGEGIRMGYVAAYTGEGATYLDNPV